MRLGLFSQGDHVLLLGEGNFSFTKCLVTHNLPIKITATCLDNGLRYKSQLENIEFLMKNNVSVHLDVDATKLHEHPILRNHLYSKIIFNFPHVGGKMKIQLNRELIKKVCESSSHLLKNGGLLIISLCNGQGGTPADNPQRKWNDSWQITEMAAYGNFCLVSVEPFVFNNFQSYDCTGYRSQDSHFNLQGALVHVLKKKSTPPRINDDEMAVKRLSLVPLSGNSNIFVPYYYADLYGKTPLNNSNSSVSFLKNLLLKHLEKLECRKKLKVVNDVNMTVTVESSNGVVCKLGEEHKRLRSSVLQVINNIVEEYSNWCAQNKVIIFPGMFFNSCMDENFDKIPPISFQFVLLGEHVSVYFQSFLNDLISLVKASEIKLSNRVICELDVCSENVIKDSIPNHGLAVEWYCVDKDIENLVAHELHAVHADGDLEIFIIYVDKLLELFFGINNWKEVWSEDSNISLDSDNNPILMKGLLYPLSYKFDITLQYGSDKGLSDHDVYETLRLLAIDLIKEVEMINEYNSNMGWSSKCYRITYQSVNEPFNRSKALDVHVNFISKMLPLALPVSIK